MAKFLSDSVNWIRRSISEHEDVHEDISGGGVRKQGCNSGHKSRFDRKMLSKS